MKNLCYLTKEDKNRYGSKAANLGEVKKAGFPVPEGFAIPIEALENYKKHNRINYCQEDYLAEGDQLREKLITGVFSTEFQSELRHNLDNVRQNSSCRTFAVRSSSLLEDGEHHSMAGMFESYIDLSSYEEVERTIKQCFAALYSDKVLNYLYEHCIDFNRLKMAVVIQEFVISSPSGVMFTADPISGNEGQLQINAVDGICADFESNRLPPSLYSVEKQEGTVTERFLSGNSPVLDTALIDLLRTAAVKLEKVFGNHLDVEWSYKDGTILILQVRPITAFSNKSFKFSWRDPAQEQYTWFRLMPAPCTPLMQEIMQIEVQQLGKGAYETMFRIDTYGEAIVQNGYLYVREYAVENGQQKREEYIKSLFELADQGKCIYHDIILPGLLNLVNQAKKYIGKELTKQETKAFLLLSLEYLKYSFRQHWPAVQANEFLYSFEAEFVQKYQDMALQDFYDLVSGPTILTRERELLFTIAGIMKKSSSLSELIQTCPYDTILYAKLKKHPEANQILSLISTYLEEFGACDSGDDVVLHPVVMERPDYIISGVRKLIDMEEDIFFETLRTSKERKDTIKWEILSRLDEAEQDSFRKKLELAEKSFLTNDNHNYYMERMYRGYLRLSTKEAGRIFCSEGILEDAEDIQFLYIDEIMKLLEGGSIDKAIVQARKAEYWEQKRLSAPEMIGAQMEWPEPAAIQSDAAEDKPESTLPDQATEMIGKLSPEQEVEKRRKLSPEQEAEKLRILSPEQPITLQGYSGLKKTVRGIVHVGMPEVLKEESILVLPHCHCGDIMPFLHKLKGLIFNWGSPYDHPGIIARELNIPAIYKTNSAMEVLKTGDEVELNGYTGTVTLLSRA